jgi:hypothetical protein
MSTVHRVYWTDAGGSMSKDFKVNELDECLKHCETLRILRSKGVEISFITIASENPDCVSLSGVDVTDSSYEWKKRRI